MAFPKLNITATEGKPQVIGSIDIVFENTTVGEEIGKKLIRDRYDIDRRFAKSTGNNGTAKKDPKIPFDMVQFIYTWVGHVNVETASLGNNPTGLPDAPSNLSLLEQAAFLSGDIDYSFPLHTNQNENDPSLVYTTYTGSENGPNLANIWDYKIDEDTLVTSPYQWMILKTSISDNLDGTSNVSFTFRSYSSWQRIAEDIIDYEA